MWFNLLFVLLSLGCSKDKRNSPVIPQPVNVKANVFQADPTIFQYNGTYYLYGTNDKDPNQGFKVYSSSNLVDWSGPGGAGANGFALLKSETFGAQGFWAPQVWYEDGLFYMAYTADENIAIATSTSPMGPFRQQNKQPVVKDGKQIDPFVFIDEDGKKYLFHVKLNNGNSIYVAELENDYSGIKSATLKQCIQATEQWENTQNSSVPIIEGPTVIKMEQKYYLFYSANDFRNPDYAVGCAVADNIYGPWKKIENLPLLSKMNTKWAGSGHGDLFQDKNGWHYVFHTHNSNTTVIPRRTAVTPVSFQKQSNNLFVPTFNTEKMSFVETSTYTATKSVSIVWDKNSIKKIAPLGNRNLTYAGYPRVKMFTANTLIGVYEADGGYEIIKSTDMGASWSNPVVVFKNFNVSNASGTTRVNISNPEIIELANGDWVAACNYRPSVSEIEPFSIAISRSVDKGKTWSTPQKIYQAEPRFKDGCWEPAFLQLPNGELQVYFANEKPFTSSDEQEISMMFSKDNGVTWNNQIKRISYRAGRRDGMPVPLIVGNEIIVAIEDNKIDQFKPYIVRTTIDNNWEKYIDANSIFRDYALADPLPDNVYAGAPYIAKLASGEVLLSYQTTRARTSDWEKSTMEVAIGDKFGRNFKKITQPFNVPLDKEAKWNAISVLNDNTVVATSASNWDGGHIGAWMIFGKVVVQ